MVYTIEVSQLTGISLCIDGEGREKHDARADGILGENHHGDLERRKLCTSVGRE